MTDHTYTDRTIDHVTITDVDPIRHTAWFDNTPPPDLAARLTVGADLDIESKATQIVGWRFQGTWWDRKSDQDLEREREEQIAAFERKAAERLEANRDDWARRTAALPDWLEPRIRHFMDRGGDTFARDGWGYELVICELAALFEAPDFADTPAVSDYCRNEGITGNQHAMARALARAHHEEPERSLAGTVSALAPITGDQDYSGENTDG